MKRGVIEPERRRLEAEAREGLRRVLEELDGTPDPDSEGTWPPEAQRPIQELDRGAVETVAAEPVLKRP